MALTEGLETVPRRLSNTRAAVSRRWTPTPCCGAIPRSPSSTSFPTRTCRARGRPKRWEDVQVLLDAGIDVLTTMNVQHLESLNDQIWQSTGVRVRETIPDWVLKQADEIVMVDLTPRAAQPARARRRVSARARAGRAAELLQGADAGGAARAGDAADGARRGKPARRRRGRRSSRWPQRSPGSVAAADRAASGQRRADSARPPRGRLPAGRVLCRVRVEDRRPGRANGEGAQRRSSASSTSRAACTSRRGSSGRRVGRMRS